jgi:hypothetical protein
MAQNVVMKTERIWLLINSLWTTARANKLKRSEPTLDSATSHCWTISSKVNIVSGTRAVMKKNMMLDHQRLSKFKCVRSSNFIVEQFSPTPFDEIRIKRWFGGFRETPHLAALDRQSRGIRGLRDPPRNRKWKSWNFSVRREEAHVNLSLRS